MCSRTFCFTVLYCCRESKDEVDVVEFQMCELEH